MLRNDRFKRICSLALTLLLIGTMLVPSFAAEDSFRPDDEDLYLEALSEEAPDTVNTYVVGKKDFSLLGASKAEIEYGGVQYVVGGVSQGKAKFEEYLVSAGKTIKKGDPIARISVTVDDYAITNANLNLAKLEESLESYKAATGELLDEYEEIAKNSSDPNERLTAQLLYDRLLATYNTEVSKREAAISKQMSVVVEYENLEGDQYITSPCSGVVGMIGRQKKGDNVGSNDMFAIVYDIGDIRLIIKGGSEYLRYNQVVSIVQTQGNETIEVEGRVTTCKSPALANGLVSYDDYVEITGDATRLYVNKDVVVRSKYVLMEDVIVIPSDAIGTDKVGSFVYLYENGVAIKKYITVAKVGTDEAWIASGLNEGDLIVIK